MRFVMERLPDRIPSAEARARALESAAAQRVRVARLAGSNRYLARSRTFEPGSYFELFATSSGGVVCGCPGFRYHGICKHSVAVEARLRKEKTGEALRVDRALPRHS